MAVFSKMEAPAFSAPLSAGKDPSAFCRMAIRRSACRRSLPRLQPAFSPLEDNISVQLGSMSRLSWKRSRPLEEGALSAAGADEKLRRDDENILHSAAGATGTTTVWGIPVVPSILSCTATKEVREEPTPYSRDSFTISSTTASLRRGLISPRVFPRCSIFILAQSFFRKPDPPPAPGGFKSSSTLKFPFFKSPSRVTVPESDPLYFPTSVTGSRSKSGGRSRG